MMDGERIYGLIRASGDEIIYMSRRELRAVREWLTTQTLPEWKSGQPDDFPPGTVGTIFGRPIIITTANMWWQWGDELFQDPE